MVAISPVVETQTYHYFLFNLWIFQVDEWTEIHIFSLLMTTGN